MILLAFLMFIPGVETKESPVKCEYSDEKKVSECLQVFLYFKTRQCLTMKKLQPMLDYATKLQAETGAMQFPLQGGQVFNQLCSIYTDFKVEAQKEYISCKIAATQAISEAQGAKGSSTEAYLTEMCRAMDGYLRCSHPIILAKCGSDAWTLVSTVCLSRAKLFF
uniref:Neuronal small secreted protein nsp-33 n=1 Tax=Caenorhabditis elegans TaxID=6239 RepID=YOL6_CAEEL|nr:RecName: Full=Uncharacterized protein ZK370.6 [Caenorhabditis elegans]